jgi:glycosyltransferase involved in cell wall biosynthesis
MKTVCGPINLEGDYLRLLCIGPYPPPEEGTSIPFKYLVDYLRANSEASVSVINREYTNKAGYSVFHPKVFLPFFSLAWRLIKGLHASDTLLVYGCQRFVATAGSLFTFLATSVYSKEANIYIAGGAFDQYYYSLSKVPRRFVRLCLSRATAIGVQTQMLYQALREELPNLVVLPNWTDLQSLTAISEATPCISNETSQNLSKFIFIGRVTLEKGIIDLLEAFKKATEIIGPKGQSIVLDIYGTTDDSSRNEVMQALQSTPASIRYHGFKAHSLLMQELWRSDVLILPTRYPGEGYPGVIIEAMALGKPIITTSWRAIPEIVEDQVNGMVCDPENQNSLTESIVAMAFDKELRTFMGANSLEMAKRFDMRNVLPDLCEAFGYPLVK